MRPVAAVSGAEAAAAADSVGCVAAASRECAGMQLVALRCNGLRYAATDAAVWAQQEGDISGKRPKRECTCSRTCPSGSLYGKRAAEWPCCAAAAMSAPSLPSAPPRTAGVSEASVRVCVRACACMFVCVRVHDCVCVCVRVAGIGGVRLPPSFGEPTASNSAEAPPA